MQVKTISYKRVLNLGSYENKHLELWAEVSEGEDDEEATSLLMEKVERKIRESQEKGIVTQIQTLETKASHLKEQISDYEQRLQELKSKEEESNQQAEEPDPDDIPFESGEAPQTNNQELSNF
ncbi:MAG: hypothetical protein V7K47_12235 [Nostoc sp.]